MELAGVNSVVYCDPPYAPLSATANFTAYHTNSFSPAEQARLAEMAEKLVSKRIPVLISNHDTPDTREWYKAAKHFQVKVRRSISSNGGTRKGGRTRLFIAPEPFCPPVNTFQGDADETVLIAPSILSADFARTGEHG